MIEIIVLCVLGVIMTEVYVRTKHPKLYALLNAALGVGGMLLSQYAATGEFFVSAYNASFSAITGIPGAILIYIFQIGG